jgi:hypothetical protein
VMRQTRHSYTRDPRHALAPTLMTAHSGPYRGGRRLDRGRTP